ncbi:MAG TPA: glycosyltransferase family 2 protein [Chitinophagaceae bacterium]|nr:glycosyltransferase family 2 protein [Chitinophagaceae bacterium]
MAEVSVIIVNYNTTEEVIRCIRSVIAQTRDVSFEIILVDNNSPDRSIDELTVLFPDIRYIRNRRNEGFGSACNTAAATAQGAFFFLLNPDTVLYNNAILLFYRFWKQHEASLALSCLGAQMSNDRGEAVHSKGDFPRMRLYLQQKVKSLANRLRTKKEVPLFSVPVKPFEAAEYVTGADLFISKKNFELVQGFDPRFFLYFEETDLQYRLAKKGRQAYLVEGPRIGHAQYKSFGGNTKQQRVLYRESMLQYFQKHNPGVRFFAFYLCWNLLDFRTLVQKIGYGSKTG